MTVFIWFQGFRLRSKVTKQGRTASQALHQPPVRHDGFELPAFIHRFRSGRRYGHAGGRPFIRMGTPFSRKPSLEHGLPVPINSGQPEQAVKPDVIYQHARFFAFRLTQSPSHLLQVLGKREGRSGQLDELYVGAVEALAEHVNVHQHLNLAQSEALHHLLAQLGRCLAVNGNGIHTFIIVVCGDVPCVADADGIHNALLTISILPHTFIQSIDSRTAVQHLVHLLHLEITVRTPFLQTVY